MDKTQLAALVAAAQSGNPQAMNTLLNQSYNDFYYYALQTTKDSDLACDATQEAMIAVTRSLHTLQEPTNFKAWSRRILYHECIRLLKQANRVTPFEEYEDGGSEMDLLEEENAEFIPDAAMEREDFRRTVLGIIGQLSEDQRSAIVMFYFDELSVREIAEIQGVSEGTVKSRLNYGRKAIKAAVEDYEKKNGIKLHSFALLPLLRWIFGNDMPLHPIPPAAMPGLTAGVAAATGHVIGGGAAATTAAAGGITAALIGKIIAGVAIAAALVGGGVWLGNTLSDSAEPSDSQTVVEDEPQQTPETPDLPQAPTDDQPTPEPPVQPSGEKYESDLLTPLEGSVRHKEQFSQVLTPNGSILQTADGKAYWVDSGESCFTDEEDVAQLVLFNKKNLGYYDSKGYFHITIRGKEYLGSDIKGTILGGFDGMLGGCFIFSVDEQGYLYANEVTVDGTKGDYVNEPLWLYDYTDKTFHGQVTDIDLFYADSGNFQIYATTADRSFYTYVSGIDHFQDKTQFFISSIEGLGRVWDYGYNKSFTSPIYSKNDADTALYYKNSDNEFAVNLPAGYTVQDIEQVLFGATTVVRMKDHTVYATELTHTVLSPTLEKLDALSNGNVVNLYHNRSANELRVLMDDNVLYSYLLQAEE